MGRRGGEGGESGSEDGGGGGEVDYGINVVNGLANRASLFELQQE